MSEKPIHIRSVLMPAYYKNFQCIMGACQDNCCDDSWKIEFSKKDYLTVKRAPKSEEMEKLMAMSMGRLREREHDGMFAEFHISEAGRCAFHTPEGLCRLQLECGEETLPKVCRTYPRMIGYSPASLECSLSPSCEGMLALLWDLKDGVDFIEDPIPREDYRVFHPENSMETRFSSVRELWIDTLQTRTLPLSRRFLLLGLMTQQLIELDWNAGTTLDQTLFQWRTLLQNPALVEESLGKMPGNRQMFMSNNLHLLFNLVRSLKELFGELLSAATDVTTLEELNMSQVTINAGRYQKLEDQLNELLDHSEHFMENLMVGVAFYLAFPAVNTPEEMWKSYVNFCNLYSMYRFTAVCAMDKEVSRARLFHAVVRVSRALIHNSGARTALRDEYFQNNSATLAHMAILVGG